MAKSGFEETQVAYQADVTEARVGQYRRFGEAGPAYEVLRLPSATHASIRVVQSGEELDYRLDRLLLDPIAITIP